MYSPMKTMPGSTLMVKFSTTKNSALVSKSPIMIRSVVWLSTLSQFVDLLKIEGFPCLDMFW